jgi:hypothetical protein
MVALFSLLLFLVPVSGSKVVVVFWVEVVEMMFSGA